MSDEVMGIRAMCEAFEVTPRALRFYEQKELLFPIREGQKRLYTRRDRARLKLILRGKRYGVSLEEIRQVLDLYGTEGHKTAQIARSLELARRRRAEMTAQRDELNNAIAELDDQIVRGEEYMAREGSQTAA